MKKKLLFSVILFLFLSSPVHATTVNITSDYSSNYGINQIMNTAPDSKLVDVSAPVGYFNPSIYQAVTSWNFTNISTVSNVSLDYYIDNCDSKQITIVGVPGLQTLFYTLTWNTIHAFDINNTLATIQCTNGQHNAVLDTNKFNTFVNGLGNVILFKNANESQGLNFFYNDTTTHPMILNITYTPPPPSPTPTQTPLVMLTNNMTGRFATSSKNVMGVAFSGAIGILASIILLKKGLGWFRQIAGLSR